MSTTLLARRTPPQGDPAWSRAVEAGEAGTPVGRLRQLASDPEPVVREHVAARAGIPADLADLLLRDPVADVAACAAQRAGITADAMRVAWHQHPGRAVARPLAGRRDLPADLIALAVAHHDTEVRRTTARRRDLTVEQQETLARDRQPLVVWALAASLRPPHIDRIATIIRRRNLVDAERALTANPHLPERHLRGLLAKRPNDKRFPRIAASRTGLPDDLATMFAGHVDWKVRAALAARLAPDSPLLPGLLADHKPQVAGVVAERADLPPELRDGLADHPQRRVRAAYATHAKDLTTERARTLARDRSAMVRQAVAGRSDVGVLLNEQELIDLATDPSDDVVATLAGVDGLPDTVLVALHVRGYRREP